MDPAMYEPYQPEIVSSPSLPVSSQTTNGVLILWGSIDPATVDEDGLNDWWTNEHLPERVCLPGFQRARRYHALEPEHGPKEYFALYETSNVQDLASAEYLYALDHPTKRTVQFMPCRFRHQAKRPRPTKLLLVLVFEAQNATDDPTRLLHYYLSRKEHGVLADITRSHIARVNTDVTRAGSVSKSYGHVQFDSSSGGDGTKTADTFVALFEYGSTANGSAPELSSSSESLTPLTTFMETAGLHIQYINTYTLLASLAKFQSAC